MKTIILCGSMKVKDKIIDLAKTLENRGYKVLLPIECIKNVEKSIASRAHLDRIINPQNEIVLIVNETKDGIANYIGPNSFAEIAFGFYFNKRVYLLNDIYEPYKDELIGWNIIPLKGDIDKLSK